MNKIYYISILFLLLIFGILSIYAQISDHLLISEVIYGNTNADDEFVEIYNPTDQEINLKELGLTLHIRNSTGTSDSNKTITWTNEIIPAYGFFLFVSQNSQSFLNLADATYSPSLVNNGAVYISFSNNKLDNVIDFISWGNHVMPEGFENQRTESFSSKQSIERKSNENGVDINLGNAWDTDSNDFIIKQTANPQNSSSAPEFHTNEEPEEIDTIPPSPISYLQANAGITSIFFSWVSPTDEDFSEILFKKGNDESISIGKVSSYLISDLEASTEYIFSFYSKDLTGNVSDPITITITTLEIPEILPPEPIKNLTATNITTNSISFSWENPINENFSEILAKIDNGDLFSLNKETNIYFLENLNDNTVYDFTLYAKDTNENLSEPISISIKTLEIVILDDVPPAEISDFFGTQKTFSISVFWQNPMDEDFSNILFSYAKNGDSFGEVKNLGKLTNFTVDDLLPSNSYQVKIQTQDLLGNTSNGLISTFSTLACNSNNSVIINEIAWAGMTVLAEEDQVLSYGHEYQWIELFNKGNEEIDLEGWEITTDQGHEILLDSLIIPANEYLILQNSEQEIFADETIIPDLIYEDPKDNENKSILFSSETTNIKLIDQCRMTVENIPSIFAGNYSGYQSMARLSVNSNSSLADSWFNEKINGSPATENIFYKTNLSIAYLNPSPYYPTPNQPFVIEATVANLSKEPAYYGNWSIQILNENEEILGQSLGVLLENYADNTVIPIEIFALEEGEYDIMGQIICATNNCGKYSTLNQRINIKISSRINEVYPSPRDEELEWIEFYNPSEVEFESTNSQLCIDDECIVLLENIPAQTYYVINENETEKFDGEWIVLKNTSSEIKWKKEEWIYNEEFDEDWDDPEDEFIFQEEIFDIFRYEGASIGQSFSRDTNGNIEKSSHITKEKDNTFNQAPVAVINIQGSGNSSGTAPFSLNVTGEDSYDADGDNLSFYWDFGNGKTDLSENPLSIKYESVGRYYLKLQVSDTFGGISRDVKTIDVYQASQSISSDSEVSVSMSNISKVDLENIKSINDNFANILFTKISINDKDNDWIEISCKTCGEKINLNGYKLYDDKVFFIFAQDIFISSENPIIIKLLDSEIPNDKENIINVEKKSGLTKTDDQLILINNKEEIVDAICWNNFDDTFAKTEIEDEQNLKDSGAWKGECVDSKSLTKKGIILFRDIIDNDTNTKEDWSILESFEDDVLLEENKEEKEINPTIEFKDGLRISELLINPYGDDKQFEWIELQNTLDESINIKNWSLTFKSKNFEFEDKELKAKEFLIVYAKESKLNLNNKSGVLILKNPKEEIVEEVKYDKVFESASFAKNKINGFEWTSINTPKNENLIFPIKNGIKDSDHDGISDELEIHLGTDPFKRDTDGDMLPDGFEIENGLDPLIFDEAGKESFQDYLKRKTSFAVKTPKKDEDLLKISGTTLPLAKVKIKVHSNLHIYKTEADNKGKWQKYITKLEKGEHLYQIQVIDKNGISSDFLESVNFNLENDYEMTLKQKEELFSKKKKSTKIVKKKGIESISDKKKVNAFLIASNYKSISKKIDTEIKEHSNLKYDYSSKKAQKMNFNVYLWGSIFLILGGIFSKQRTEDISD